MVVLGDGIQDPRHPNHDATRELISALPDVRFFGYIDLGVHSPHHQVQNLRMEQIRHRAAAWKQLGMSGVLLDDYGYDFATTRQRQIEAVESLRSHELSVIANSWDPRHALDQEPGPANPKGIPSPLGKGDFYLYESYLVSNGEWTGFKNWRSKANTLARFLGKGVEEVSCTTATPLCSPDEMWPFTALCAWMEGHRACGWGEPNFSAGDNLAPWRNRPDFPQAPKGQPRGRGAHSLERPCQEGLAIANYLSKEFTVQPTKPWWERLLPLRR